MSSKQGMSSERKSEDNNEGSTAKVSKQSNEEGESVVDIPNKIQKNWENSKYIGEGIKSGEHGSIFQLKLLMLCLWRAAHPGENNKTKYKEFRLATENPEAEKFDDITFQYREHNSDKWKFRLLQAKHKEGATFKDCLQKIKLQELQSTGDKDFSLQKYFRSYLKIVQKCRGGSIHSVFYDSEIEDVIVITNTDFDSEEERSMFVKEDETNKADDLLKTEGSCVYKLRDEENNIEEINKLKITFENSSDFYKLIELLAEHLLSNKQIDKANIFKEYYYPLLNEIGQIVPEGKGKEVKYFFSLDNFIMKKNVHGEDLSNEATMIRDALLKEIAFRKGTVRLPEIDENLGNSVLPNYEKELKELAIKVAEFIKENKKLTVEDFQNVHVGLPKEIIDIKNRSFENVFKNGLAKTSEVKKFRRILLDEIKNNDIPITINSEEITIRKLDEPGSLRKLLVNNSKIEVSPGFANEFKPEKNPTIAELDTFTNIMTEFINNHNQDNVVEINDKIKTKLNINDKDFKLFNKNIKKLAGHVLIYWFKKIRFSTAFLKSGNLPGNIDKFKNKLNELLGNDKFELLSEYELKIDNFSTCEDGDIYRKLPVAPNDEDVQEFISKLKFIVNFPNRMEISKLLRKEICDKFKKLESNHYHSSFYENLRNWMADRVGTFYTADGAKALFQEIKDYFLLETIDGFNYPYFAYPSKEYVFTKYSVLNEFLRSNEQVLQLHCSDLVLGHTRLVQAFQDLQKADIGDIQEYTRSFGHIFLYLKQLEDQDYKSMVFEVLKCKSQFNLAVIECNGEQQEIDELYNKLVEIIRSSNNKKVIFITDKGNDALGKKFETDLKYRNEVDESGFNDLIEESQNKLLEKEVKLQGQNVSLNKLIDKSDGNISKIINAATLVKLIKGEEISIGSKPPSMSDLEGAYTELFEEINKETFVHKMFQKSNDIYIISDVSGSNKKENLINYLEISNSIGISNVNYLKSQIQVCNTNEIKSAITKRILVSESNLEDEDFKKICQNNPENKVYWISLQNKGNLPIFILKQIYTSDFYVTGKRFNNEVVIDKRIKELLSSSGLSEKIIIGGKSKNEITRWLQHINDSEEKRFEENCQNNKIQCLPSEVNVEVTFQEQIARYKDETVHLLEFKQDRLLWCKTHGSLKKLSKYRSGDCRNTEILIKEDDLIKEINDKKVVILAGDPGMGKSTTLVKLYEFQSDTDESIIKSHWVVKINLKDHLKDIRGINFSDGDTETVITQITKFLSQVDKTINDDFTKGLLSTGLLKGRWAKPLLIAFDGFDEVLDEPDRNKIVSLLEHLKDKTRAKFWITTRLHYEQTLEDALSIFATKFYPMNEKKKSEFIKRYLSNPLSLMLSRKEFKEVFGNGDDEIEYTKMQEYTEALISTMDDVFKGNISKFIGTPLQLYLLLEGSVGHCKKWIDSDVGSQEFSYLGNDMWEVYERFINRKYDTYFRKVDEKNAKMQQDILKEMFDSFNEDFAISLIFKSEPKKKLKKFIDLVLSIGIIRSDGNNIDFIHTTIGEYFTAKKFIHWIEKWKEKGVFAKKKKLFLKDILLKPERQVIRIFLNAKLIKEKIKNVKFEEKHDNKEILFLAARENNIGIAGFMLDNFQNVNINVQGALGYTAIHFAAKFKNWDMLKWLVNEKKADINASDNMDETVLHQAVNVYADLEIIKWMVVENNSNVNAITKNGETVLHYAANEGNEEVVKWLVNEKSANVNAKDNDGLTVLHLAARSGNLDLVKYLVNEKNCDVNAADKIGYTVLHTAAAANFRNVDVVKWLVNEKSANVNAKDCYGSTVLLTAAASNNWDMLMYLVNEKNCDVNAADKKGYTVLHRAASNGDEDIVKWLVNKKSANVNAKRKDGTTVLHSAAGYGNLDLIKYLVNENNCDVNAADKSGYTVLHTAAECGNVDIVKWLVNEKNTNVNAKDNGGTSVLHSAARSGNLDLIKYLVNEKNFDVNAADKKGHTVQHYAASCGKEDIVKWLVNEKSANLKMNNNSAQCCCIR